MSQYTPAYKAVETPPFDRGVTEGEYESVAEAAADPKLALLGENMPVGRGVVR